MPRSVLTRKRSWIARISALAMLISLLAVAAPASAHSVAIDTTATCPSTIPSAGFTDISAFDAETQHAINCIAFYEISIGTTATTYSPSLVTLRRHMALFLIRAATDMGVTIPTPSDQGFQDISALPQEEQNAINQLAQLGITVGTSSTTFSPNEDVDRWEMALFLRRLLNVAGFTFTDDATHGNFTDIGTLSAEAQAAIDDLADAHIALGVGGSLYAPFNAVSRWQMALFLTRVLAADGVVAAGTQVTVTPSASASQAPGTARQYTAAFKNADGTNYTGQVIIRLRDATSAGALGTTAATGVHIESVDGTATAGTPVSVTAFAGPDGQVVFVVRHTAAATAADAIPQGIIDADADGTFDSGEQSGVGGAVFFGATAVTEATAPGPHTVTVVSTNKAGDSFVGNPGAGNCGNGVGINCRFDYDDNDIYIGDATTMAEFETDLSAADVVVANPYATAAADQSTFNLTDNVASLTVNAPTTPVDAANATLSGTANPGWEVTVYRDQNSDNDAGTADDDYQNTIDVPLVTVTANADGAWSASVPLNQSTTNHFVAVQRSAGSSTTAAVTNAVRDTQDVPTITETTTVGTLISSTVGANVAPSAVGTLSPNDTITINFSGDITGVSNGDTIGLLDADGTTATLTLGTNASFTLADGPDADLLTDDAVIVTITNVLTTVGGTTGGINPVAQIESISGFTAADGTAINVSGSGAGRAFGGF